MPKLWSDTIESHRHDVREAIVRTTVELVRAQGLRGVTMLQIAEKAGIGRATLYKYFPDVETILLAWHQDHVHQHLEELVALRDGEGEPIDRLRAVLERLAAIQHQSHGVPVELTMHLHAKEHVARAMQHLVGLLRELIVECVRAGSVRKDVPAEELATFCLRALGAAATLKTKPAVARLVMVIMAGLQP